MLQELFKVEPGVGRLLGRVRLMLTAVMVCCMSPVCRRTVLSFDC